jgi:hypothetical protein
VQTSTRPRSFPAFVSPTDALVRQGEVALAVRFLAAQLPRGLTHQQRLTASDGRRLP